MAKLDGTLMKPVKYCDTSVIETVTEVYGKSVFLLAQSIIKDSEKAIDITCEVFSIFNHSSNEYNDAENIENKLFQTCRRLCLHAHAIDAKHTDNPSLHALNSLPVRYGSVLILSDVHSVPLSQIAILWGTSEKKVSKWLSNGRMLIGKILKKQISE